MTGVVLLIIWHGVVHFLGVDYGAAYGHWIWYNFWSGVAGSFLCSLIAVTVLMWWRSTCHYSWTCLRHGKHPAAGGTFMLCWAHHPDLGVRPHHDLIHQLHQEHKDRHGPPAQASD